MDKGTDLKFLKENKLFLYNPRTNMENGRVAHPFLKSARYAGGLSASGSGHLSPDRKLGGSQCLSLCFGKKKNLLQFPTTKPQFLGYPAHKLHINEPALSLCETINTYRYFEMSCKEMKERMLLFWLLIQT